MHPQPPEASYQHLFDYTQRLLALHRSGLPLHSTLLLHRMWAGGTLTHHMRANVMPVDFALKWDRAVCDFWEVALERVNEFDDLTRDQIK